MKIRRKLVVIALAAAFISLAPEASVQAAGSETPSAKYIDGKGARFESLAGSHRNLTSLVHGLRTGDEVTLVERTPTGPRITTFDPPTRPMGYGNITRSLDLASRQLASHGITDPTAAELKAALNGGTVKTANGDVRLDGVLRLRSEGMGWGKIAHTIGVHPGNHANGKAFSHAGTAGPKPTPHAHTAAGAGQPKHHVHTAAGAGHAGTGTTHGHKGIVTAAGGSPSVGAGSGHGTTINAAGAPASPGVKTAMGGGNGNGHAYGRAGK